MGLLCKVPRSSSMDFVVDNFNDQCGETDDDGARGLV
jgi:hypothetical protein